MSGLTDEQREVLHFAVDAAENCDDCGDSYGWKHIYATVERLIRDAKAEAWDEGHRGLCRRHGVVPFSACRNPYRDGTR